MARGGPELNHVRPVRSQPLGMGDRRVGLQVVPAVREGVLRDVDDADDAHEGARYSPRYNLSTIGPMKLSTGVEWGLHACSLLALTPSDKTLEAAKLAEFHELPPAYLAKHLQALARAGIIEPAYGKNGGYRLAKPAGEITLLAIVIAIEGDEPAFRCAEIRRDGPCGGLPNECYLRPCAFAAAMWQAERAWRDRLNSVSLADVTKRMLREIAPEERRRGSAWLTTNARP
jgi:Rrf2 family protein